MGSVYKQQLNDWVASQGVKAKLLYDIGGAQNPLKGRTASWDVEEYKIVDLAVPHVEKVHPDIEHDMNEPIHPAIRKADAIYCLGVADYIINPNIFMENIYNMLADNGMAWVEFPFAYAHHEPLMDEGCRYSEGCIHRLAAQSGLEIQTIIRKMEASGLLRQWYAVERQRTARDYDYHGVTGFIVRFTK